ncbi:MAG: DUF5017 domain-containing protein [Lentimicrobium sp.]|nr:DUF5017 domain-containing protein [Lentimicrobium sp.]
MKKYFQKLKGRSNIFPLLVAILSLTGFQGFSQSLMVENFDYSIGALLTDNGWNAHSGAGTQAIDVTNGLSFAGYLGSGIGGAANLDNNGEDVHKTFPQQTSGVVYAAFIIQTQSTNSAGYFLHFGQTTIGTTFFTRVWVNAAGNGVGIGSSTPTSYISISPDVPVLIVIKLDIATKISSLYVFNSFPSSEPATADATFTETASFSNVGSIALRQYNASERVIVDGIRVASTWADAATAAGGNIPPIISNIVQTPASGITPSTTVSVSADVTDSDGTITSVVLKWGTTSGNLPNTINMPLASGNTYTTASNIPAQPDGTTVYYAITATDNGAATTTSPEQSYVVSNPATQLAFVNFPATGTVGQPITTFTVEARRADALVDPGFTGNITLTIASGSGTLGGTATRAAVAGIATFNDITFSSQGSYTLNANSTGLTQATSSSIAISPAPAITAAVLPQFINAAAPSNNRVPFAFRATISNLLPNATYRYINQLVTSADGPTISGAGNPIYVNADGTFTRTSSPSLSTAGGYGEFTTDASGSYSGWFISETTTNARFNAGNQVYARIRLNNGAEGTTAVSYPTSVDFTTAISFGETASVTEGTAIRAISSAAPKNFVFLYDNINGTGRPLFGTSIETTGIDFSAITSYAPFYRDYVSGVNGSWGGIVPNINANGVRRVEERSLTSGAIVNADTSPNGVWGTVNTANPTGGTTEVLVIDLNLGTDPAIVVSPTTLNGFYYVTGAGPSAVQTYTVSALNLFSSGNIVVNAPADYEISLDGTTFVNQLNLPFASGVITGQPITVSVRLKAGLPAGTYNNELISHSGGAATTTNVTCNGMVQNAAFTTLPYTEDFTTGLGLCLPYSVSGDTKTWIHNSALGYASMNGFNSGELEEDWLILPGIDLVANTNVGFNFSSWMRYGIDNEDNYFKLLYSTDYPGLGDPTSYTWTELSFAYPTAEQTWTPSGTVNLSSISAPSVFIAFKYHYSPNFYRSWQLDNFEIAVMANAVLSVSPATLSGFTYVEGAGPSQIQTYQLNGTGLIGSGNIIVTAPANYEISSDGTTFAASLSYPFAAGVITGQPKTVSVRLKAGLSVGDYNAETIINAGGGATDITVTCNGSVTSATLPAIASETVPQWIQGVNGTNNKRLPFAYRLELANLTPNATYRYFNQAVIGTDTPTANGAGNPILVNSDGTFIRTSSPSMSTAGGYGEFITDATGSFSGWFMFEATGNNRFTPGNQVFMRLMLNDGNGGTAVATRLTTTNSASVINFGTTSDVLQGTGIRGISTATPKNFVFLYDNVAGTGRPLYGSSVETVGLDYASFNSYATFYTTEVQGNDGSWGGIIPNVNSNGVKLIEERSRTTGAVVNTNTSADGVWGTTDTRNPVGGDVNILVIDLTGGTTPVLTVNPSVLNGFTYIEGSGPSATQTYQLSGTNLEGTGNIVVTAPANYEISSDGTTFFASLNFPFAAGVITGQPKTVSVRLKAGLAVGNYNGELISNSGGGATDKTVACNGSVTSVNQPEITSEIIPQWIQGIASNSQRLPYAFWLSISNLSPNSTYRYINQAVVGTDSPTTNGAGNPIFVNSDGTFTRTSSTSLANPGEYGEFLTDAAGSFSGWFILEATGNSRFTPGNQVFMRLRLNDGNEGTAVLTMLTSTASAGVINFGVENDVLQGTGIRAISTATPKNFVFLYDNVSGTGRPLYGTSIETTGVDFAAAGTYATFYSTEVQGNDGSWGGIVPNVNPNGIMLIEERSRTSGAVVTTNTSSDGVWGTTDTRNPLGGDVDILVIDLIGGTTPVLNVSPAVLNGFTYTEGNGPSTAQTYILSGTNLEGSGNISVTAPADYEISSDGTTFVSSLSFPFASGIITGQPKTVSVRLKAGLAAGDYNGQTIVNAGGGATDKTVTCNGAVTPVGLPELSVVTLPLFIEGINGTNNSRVPFAYYATLTNLLPNATYRYYNKIVVETDAADYNGAGNCIFVGADGTFSRTTATSLANPGEHGVFTTDAAGSFTGWFITEPTGNARFTPGNQLFMRIMLNNGSEGTTEAYRLTTDDYATVLQFGTEANPTHGTAIRGISGDSPKDIVFLYDNINGNGRPLYGTHIESCEVDFASVTSYAPFYINEVAAHDGAWGGIVPNVNSAGVQRVEVRGLNDGAIENVYNVPSGIWIDTDTRNPNGGLEGVLVLDLISIGVDSPDTKAIKVYASGNDLRIEALNAGTYEFTLINLQGQQVINRRLSGSDSYTVPLNIPAGIYLVRLVSSEGTMVAKVFVR